LTKFDKPQLNHVMHGASMTAVAVMVVVAATAPIGKDRF
jgi:hypothetical protein